MLGTFVPRNKSPECLPDVEPQVLDGGVEVHCDLQEEVPHGEIAAEQASRLEPEKIMPQTNEQED